MSAITEIKKRINIALSRASPEKVAEAEARAKSDTDTAQPYYLKSAPLDQAEVRQACQDFRLLLAFMIKKYGYDMEDGEKARAELEKEWREKKFNEVFLKMLLS